MDVFFLKLLNMSISALWVVLAVVVMEVKKAGIMLLLVRLIQAVAVVLLMIVVIPSQVDLVSS